MKLRSPRAALNTLTHQIHRLPILMVVTTTRCQSLCVSCGYRSTGVDLSDTDIEPWLEALPRLRPKVIVFTGGEPLLHPRLHEHSAMLVEASGGRSQCVSWLLTNGLSLHKEIERVAGTFDRVTLSLDGWDQGSYRRIRGVDGWNALVRGCDALRARAPRIRLEARVTVHAGNARELLAICRSAAELGSAGASFVLADERDHAFGDAGIRDVPGWSEGSLGYLAESVEQLVQARGGLLKDILLPDDEVLRGLASRARSLSAQVAESPLCNAPWLSAVLEPGGSVRPCFFQPPYLGTGPEALLGSGGSEVRRQLRVDADPICNGCTCALHIRKHRLLL